MTANSATDTALPVGQGARHGREREQHPDVVGRRQGTLGLRQDAAGHGGLEPAQQPFGMGGIRRRFRPPAHRRRAGVARIIKLGFLGRRSDRRFRMKHKTAVAAAGAGMLALLTSAAGGAATKGEIDIAAADALSQFATLNIHHRDLEKKAEATLVFPRVTKAGVGVAGEYGEGVLLIDGKAVGYYSLSSASLGLTVGAEKHKEIIMFMTPQALNRFTSSRGWSVGADTGVAVISKGEGAEYDTKTSTEPVLGFVFAERGLIGDLSLEGSKVSKIER